MRSLTLSVLASISLLAAAQDGTKNLRGVVRIDGSSTVYPITEAVAEEFSKVAPKVNVTVGISGTGGGFKRFTAGETDVSDASRPITASESAAAEKNGISFIEIPVAYDALSFVVNPKNTWVKSLTVDQIRKLYSTKDTAKTWKDLDPSWPDRPIHAFSPGTDSGTFDYFKEVVLGKEGKVRADLSVSEDDNVLVSGVAGDIDAIGYFGLAYYAENQDKLRVVPIDGGKGAITPSEATVNDGTYVPFSRPLYIYVARKAADRPEVAAFIDFYLQKAGELASEVGYIKLPATVDEQARTAWKDRKTGSTK